MNPITEQMRSEHSIPISALRTRQRAEMVRALDAVMCGYGICEESRQTFWAPVVEAGVLR